jgi:hypothetical protein
LRTAQIDRNKIDLVNDGEARYWLRHLATAREQLELAIATVGNSADSVKKELQRRSSQNSNPARGRS